MKLFTKRLIERARRLGGGVSERFGVRLEFSPREWWLFTFRRTLVRDWQLGVGLVERPQLDVWIRLLPFLPLHLKFAGRGRLTPPGEKRRELHLVPVAAAGPTPVLAMAVMKLPAGE